MRFFYFSFLFLCLVFFYTSCGQEESEEEISSTSSESTSTTSDNQTTNSIYCNNKITIDGLNSDWSDIESVLTDNTNDGGTYNSLDISKIFLINDSKHVCLRLDRTGTQIPSNEHLSYWVYFNATTENGKSFALNIFIGSGDRVNPQLWDTTGTSDYNEFKRIDETIQYNTTTTSFEFAWSLDQISKDSTYILSFYTHHTVNKDWEDNGDSSDNTVNVTFTPTVISTSPSNNGSSISVSDNISVTFSESMDTTSVTANTSDTSCSGTLQVSSDNFSTCVQISSSPSVTNSNKTFIVDPTDNLSYSTTYKIRVTTGVNDSWGDNLVSQFETPNGFKTSVCNPTCTGLVAHYTFNGNSNNSISNNYHAVTKDNTTQPVLVSDRNGKPFSSYQFDGIDDYLVIDNASELNIDNGSFSFVAWVSIDKFNGYNYTGNDGRIWGGSLIFSSDLNNMTNLGWGRWNDMEGNTGMYSFVVDNTTTWHTNYIKIFIHIAAVFDKDNKNLIYYVYGKKKEEKNWSGSYLLPVTKFHFGSNANKSNFTNMRIDDFQIYNKSLSQSEVIELYQSSSF